jgi:hypothetical protein
VGEAAGRGGPVGLNEDNAAAASFFAVISLNLGTGALKKRLVVIGANLADVFEDDGPSVSDKWMDRGFWN